MTITQMRYAISSRPMVLQMVGTEKLAKTIVAAGKEFTRETGKAAQVAYVAEIPEGVNEGQEVQGIMLIQVSWVEPGCVAVGAGGMESIDQEFRKWIKK